MAPPTDTGSDDAREETELERLDRNTVELLNELRVAATGVQVMLAFLLVVPFNARWSRVTAFDRVDYFVTLLCVSAAAVLLIAPSMQHRLLFQRGEKPYLVQMGNRSAIAGGAFLAVGITGALILLSDVLFGAVSAAIVGGVSAVVVSTLWFWIPLRRRLRSTGRARQQGSLDR
jgi:O-antigen/teichoic acid export membrane protein